MSNSKRILLVYPQLGMAGSLVRHLPLSLMYAAVDSLKQGFAVDLADTRFDSANWRERLASLVTGDTLMLGVSVMSGAPIKHALDISRWARERFPNLPVVWGGPHATFNGPEILDEPSVDYVISGYGSKPLAMLASRLAGREGAPEADAIPGLCYREGHEVRCIPPEPEFEIIDWRDIPYHLIEKDLDRYGQLENGDRIFPMYSAVGCPYQCAFCSSPAQYRGMGNKYVPLSPADVADHVEMVHARYGANYIYFIDDDSFVRPSHVEAVIDEIDRRGITVRMGFRGARISEIKGMSHEFLSKLARAGTNIMHIGAESGSPAMLKLCNKGCTVEDILEVNRKMAAHPEICTAYNWIVGLPGETLEDLRLTRELILRMVEENPHALIFMPNKYRPLPGTELHRISESMGYQPPRRLEDWLEVEAEGDFRPPWYTRKFADTINMMQVASFFIDDKLFKVKTGNTWRFRILRFLAQVYKPVAMFRFRRGISFGLVEYWMFHLFTSFFRN